MPDINKVIARPEYDFLRTNEHVADRVMFLTFGGSHAYGTSTPTSDIDICGCAMASESDILGLTNFNQVIDNATDTTIYSAPRLVQLLMGCNPNCIELLGGRPEHYTMVSPAGHLLLDNAHLFLSQRAIDTFGGYATQQLRRLQNAVARDALDEIEKEMYILEACERQLRHMNERYTELPEGAISLSIDKSQKEAVELEIQMSADLKGYPLRDFVSIWRELNDVCKNYKGINHRNHKKDAAHLAKHCMHLIRLYFTLEDILVNERIVTYREKEIPLLMDIRNGKYMDADGKVIPEFYQLLEEVKTRVEYAEKHTALPKTCDFKKVNELMMEINRMALS